MSARCAFVTKTVSNASYPSRFYIGLNIHQKPIGSLSAWRVCRKLSKIIHIIDMAAPGKAVRPEASIRGAERTLSGYTQGCRGVLAIRQSFITIRESTMRQLMILLAMVMFVSVSACHKVHKPVPPGHDPSGPGNSENAPGHNK